MVTEPDADGVYRPSAALLRRGVPDARADELDLFDPEDLSILDRRLIKEAAKRNGVISPVDLAEAVGFNISPARAYSRLREILNNRDLLTVEHKLALHMEDLADLKSYIQTKMDNDEGLGEVQNRFGLVVGNDIGDPRWSGNMLKVLIATGNEYDKALARLDKVDTKVTSGHANILISALDRVVTGWLFTMRQLYPEIDELTARNAMEDRLAEAFQIVDDATND